MYAACASLADGVVSRAADLMGDFLPVIALVGGVALGMWVLGFVRSLVVGD